MHRVLFAAVLGVMFAGPVYGQIGSGASLPSNCNTGGGSLFYLTSGDAGLYICQNDTWTKKISPGGGGAGGASAWGDITGTLSNQADLQTALDGKGTSNFSGAYADLTGKPTLGTAAATAIGDYATAAQGVKADSALQPSGNGSSLTGLTKSQVGLGNVDNTSDANKPVSTAQQTALDAKQAALVSGTNIKTINGSSVLGSGDLVVAGTGSGYTLMVQALSSNPVDATTIYFGQLPKAPVTTQGTSRVYIRKAGAIKHANIFSFSSIAGTAEAWPCHIRLNNTGDTQIASLAVSAGERTWSHTALNIAVVVGDYVEVKCVNPTWVTNPGSTVFGGYLYIE